MPSPVADRKPSAPVSAPPTAPLNVVSPVELVVSPCPPEAFESTVSLNRMFPPALTKLSSSPSVTLPVNVVSSVESVLSDLLAVTACLNQISPPAFRSESSVPITTAPSYVWSPDNPVSATVFIVPPFSSILPVAVTSRKPSL